MEAEFREIDENGIWSAIYQVGKRGFWLFKKSLLGRAMLDVEFPCCLISLVCFRPSASANVRNSICLHLRSTFKQSAAAYKVSYMERKAVLPEQREVKTANQSH